MAEQISAGGELGWCEHTPPNETLDDEGNLAETPEAELDPRAPSQRRYGHPEVEQLRRHLKDHSGIKGLEICAPEELDRIVEIFHRDGFVVVKDLLTQEQVEQWNKGCERIMGQILSYPGQGQRKYLTETRRLPHRYSYGTSSASRELLHEIEWARMIDLPTTTPILQRLFATEEYCVLGSGGDFCLPGAIEYQVLHVDFPDQHILYEERVQQAERLGVTLRRDEHGELTPRTQQLALIKTPPVITINFMMSELTTQNGPIRHIPGTHAFPHRAPDQFHEPEWMRLSTLVGAPPGAGVFRDSRAWHGATPNLSREVRAMPNVEYAAPWRALDTFNQTMPRTIYDQLGEYAQHLARRVVAPEGVWPAGAGNMHPVACERNRIKEASASG